MTLVLITDDGVGLWDDVPAALAVIAAERIAAAMPDAETYLSPGTHDVFGEAR